MHQLLFLLNMIIIISIFQTKLWTTIGYFYFLYIIIGCFSHNVMNVKGIILQCCLNFIKFKRLLISLLFTFEILTRQISCLMVIKVIREFDNYGFIRFRIFFFVGTDHVSQYPVEFYLNKRFNPFSLRFLRFLWLRL